MAPDDIAATLGAFGYAGFAHLALHGRLLNPAELLLRALTHADLDTRLVEALPWGISRFANLDWDWLIAQASLLAIQNRLGYLVELAIDLHPEAASPELQNALAALNRLRLQEEGTLCRDSMPEPERQWIRLHRTPLAAHWNLLTTLRPDDLRYASRLPWSTHTDFLARQRT